MSRTPGIVSVRRRRGVVAIREEGVSFRVPVKYRSDDFSARFLCAAANALDGVDEGAASAFFAQRAHCVHVPGSRSREVNQFLRQLGIYVNKYQFRRCAWADSIAVDTPTAMAAAAGYASVRRSENRDRLAALVALDAEEEQFVRTGQYVVGVSSSDGVIQDFIAVGHHPRVGMVSMSPMMPLKVNLCPDGILSPPSPAGEYYPPMDGVSVVYELLCDGHPCVTHRPDGEPSFEPEYEFSVDVEDGEDGE